MVGARGLWDYRCRYGLDAQSYFGYRHALCERMESFPHALAVMSRYLVISYVDGHRTCRAESICLSIANWTPWPVRNWLVGVHFDLLGHLPRAAFVRRNT